MRDIIQEFLDRHIEMPYRSEVRRRVEALIESKCKEQREICAEKAKTGLTPTSIIVDKDSIRNAPSPDL